MSHTVNFDNVEHDPRDPNPWLALYLDQSTPIDARVKQAWLTDSSSRCRQYFLPVVRPFARGLIVLFQLVKTAVPDTLTSSRLLHRILAWGLRTFVRPEANWLILRHFHVGSEILDFIARNVPGTEVPLNPLRPGNLKDLRDDLFLKHDLNLFNFVINLNRQLREQGRDVACPATPDFSGISEGRFGIEPMPARWHNFIDLQTAIEVFTPVYQLFLTDNDFWRATNSLQLDETIAIYVARILAQPHNLVLLNNKHPMVPLSTLRAGYRLMLHGLASEMLYELLVRAKRDQATTAVGERIERNQKNVLGFYDLATNQSKPREAVEKFVGDTYIQHNPEVADGKEAFIAYFEKQAKDFPTKRFEFRRVLADGDFVVVHVYSIFPEYWRDKEWAGIDIFRLDERGKIVEHWDVLQPIPSSAANRNGMF